VKQSEKNKSLIGEEEESEQTTFIRTDEYHDTRFMFGQSKCKRDFINGNKLLIQIFNFIQEHDRPSIFPFPIVLLSGTTLSTML